MTRREPPKYECHPGGSPNTPGLSCNSDVSHPMACEAFMSPRGQDGRTEAAPGPSPLRRTSLYPHPGGRWDSPTKGHPHVPPPSSHQRRPQ